MGQAKELLTLAESIIEGCRITESDMTAQEFCEQVKSLWAKYMPDSMCYAQLKVIVGDPLIVIQPFVVKDKSESLNNILTNDILDVSFKIDLPRISKQTEFNHDEVNVSSKDNPVLPDDITMEVWKASVLIKPENQYMAYGREKFRFRKSAGSPEKILKVLDKYFGEIHKTLVSLKEADKLPPNHPEIEGKF